MFVVADRLVDALKAAEWVEGGNFPQTSVVAGHSEVALKAVERAEVAYYLVNPVEVEEVPFGLVPSAVVD